MTSKRTKQERLIAIADEYQKMAGKTEFEINEVADWAMNNGLVPVPGMREAIESHVRWDRLFWELTGNPNW